VEGRDLIKNAAKTFNIVVGESNKPVTANKYLSVLQDE